MHIPTLVELAEKSAERVELECPDYTRIGNCVQHDWVDVGRSCSHATSVPSIVERGNVDDDIELLCDVVKSSFFRNVGKVGAGLELLEKSYK